MSNQRSEKPVRITLDSVFLEGMLSISNGSPGVVVFAHGSGSSRRSPRNNFVASVLQNAGLGTLLFDLLTEEEDTVYQTRFDISLLTDRLKGATTWLMDYIQMRELKIGYFGSSTGAAAALIAAADFGAVIKAVVSRGGRPDLAEGALERVQSPTLLIVGGNDVDVLELNRKAYEEVRAEKELKIIPGATHLFEEPGALEKVAHLATEWFKQRLGT